MKNLSRRLRQWAQTVKRDVYAVYLVSRDPRIPWYVKLIAVLVAAYALSPIDLIPDFVPVLGYLDDVLILPLGILFIVHLVPPEIMAEHRVAAEKAGQAPRSWAAAVVIVLLWALILAALVQWVLSI